MYVMAKPIEELGAAVNGARKRMVINIRVHIERDGAHVEKHAGDVNNGGKEKDSLATEEYRKEHPRQPLRQRLRLHRPLEPPAL